MQRVVLAISSLLLAAPASAQGVTANFVASVTSGPAPLAVGFDATVSSHSDPAIQADRFRALHYEWDYGDPASGNWAPTGNSRNAMTGALGAHVFEPTQFGQSCSGTPCEIFDVVLTVRDPQGRTSSRNQSIVVYDPNAPGPGWGDPGETACVHRSTVGSGCPAGATALLRTGSIGSILTELVNNGSYRRVLFKGGETWTASGLYYLGVEGPGLIGSYGGSKARIDVTAFRIFQVDAGHWRFQDLHFDTPNGSGEVWASNGQVRHLLVQRTTTAANRFASGIFNMPINTMPVSSDDNRMHRHLFLVDNQWGDINGTAVDYQVFTVGWGVYILGNNLGSSTAHTVRHQGGMDLLISNNYMASATSMTHDAINLRSLSSQCSACSPSGQGPKPFCGTPVSHFIVQDNDLLCYGNGCAVGVQRTCAFQVPEDSADSPAFDVVFERNHLRKTGPSAGNEGLKIVLATGSRGVIRNNVCDTTGWGTSGTAARCLIGGRGIKIVNNTCFRTDASTGPANNRCIQNNGGAEIYNNVLYAPNWTGNIEVVRDLANPNLTNNYDNSADGGLGSNPFRSANPRAVADLIPRDGSPLVDAGRAVEGLRQDALLMCRESAIDVGALERGASACQGGGTAPPTSGSAPAAPVLLP